MHLSSCHKSAKRFASVSIVHTAVAQTRLPAVFVLAVCSNLALLPA